MKTLGIDTSNYATSLAVVSDNTICAHVKIPLPVPEGGLGLRQGDAVFAHVKSLPQAFQSLSDQQILQGVNAIGVSARPRDQKGSYMPCFLAGLSVAQSAASLLGIPVHSFSHQAGHLMAALFGTGSFEKEDLSFIAFHVSGGTTESLYCRLMQGVLTIEPLGRTLDLYAGQAVDRVGVMLGLQFPAGEALSALAMQCPSEDAAKPVIKDENCCLSGLQNQCERLFQEGRPHAYIARYCLNSIAAVIVSMTRALLEKYSDINVLYTGGVLSSMVIRLVLQKNIQKALFCTPTWLAGDNAVGTALLAARKERYL